MIWEVGATLYGEKSQWRALWKGDMLVETQMTGRSCVKAVEWPSKQNLDGSEISRLWSPSSTWWCWGQSLALSHAQFRTTQPHLWTAACLKDPEHLPMSHPVTPHGKGGWLSWGPATNEGRRFKRSVANLPANWTYWWTWLTSWIEQTVITGKKRRKEDNWGNWTANEY